MQFQIVKEPMSIIEADMNKGESITANAGAMVYMSGNIAVDTEIRYYIGQSITKQMK